MSGTVYLLHFDRPLAHARHYLGYCDGDLDRRLSQHRSGNGARIMSVVAERGITWRLVRTWEGGRHVERALKRKHDSCSLCPVCRVERRAQQSEGQRRRRSGAGSLAPLVPLPDPIEDFEEIPF